MNYSVTDGLSFVRVSVRYLKSLSEAEKAEEFNNSFWESGSVRADRIIKVKEIYRG